MKLNKVLLTETKARPPAPLLGHKAIAIGDKFVLDEKFSSLSVSLGQVLQMKNIVLEKRTTIIHNHSIRRGGVSVKSWQKLKDCPKQKKTVQVRDARFEMCWLYMGIARLMALFCQHSNGQFLVLGGSELK